MLADVVFSTEALVVIGALVASLTGAVAVLFKLLIGSKDQQLKDMESRAKSYEEISQEALDHLEEAASRRKVGNGEPKPPLVAAVIPEHSSPTTKKQRETADLQTMRARLVAATLNLGLPPRAASPPAEEE